MYELWRRVFTACMAKGVSGLGRCVSFAPSFAGLGVREDYIGD